MCPCRAPRWVTPRRGARRFRGRPGRGGGAAGDQFDRQGGGLGGAAVEHAHQGPHAGLAEFLGGQPYGRQLRLDGDGQGQVVEAGDGDVLGDPQAQPAYGLAGARGDDVVVAEQRRGAGAGGGQGGLCGVQPGVDAEGGWLAAQQRAGDAVACFCDGAGAQVEGPGVHIGREVGDAAMAERRQMGGQLSRAVGDVQVDGGGGPVVVGVAVQHDQRQVRVPEGSEGLGGHGGGDHAVQGGRGGAEGVAGGADAFGGGVEDHSEVVVGGDPGRAGVDAGEEFGGQGGDDQQGGAGAAHPQAAGGEVGAVAQLAGGGADGLGLGGGDPAAPFVAQDERDGGLGDSRGAGHVPAGGAAAGRTLAGCGGLVAGHLVYRSSRRRCGVDLGWGS